MGFCLQEFGMGKMELQEYCIENKQSAAASSSSISEGSSGIILPKSRISSPTATSPFHRRTSGPIRRAKGGWTPDEDETLKKAVGLFRGKSWKKIGETFLILLDEYTSVIDTLQRTYDELGKLTKMEKSALEKMEKPTKTTMVKGFLENHIKEPTMSCI
ncbi:hypothetical protein R6Q57_028476 [Mikania cordata]